MRTVYAIKYPNGLYRIGSTGKPPHKCWELIEGVKDKMELVGTRQFEDADSIVDMIRGQFQKQAVRTQMTRDGTQPLYRLSTEDVDGLLLFLSDLREKRKLSPKNSPSTTATGNK